MQDDNEFYIGYLPSAPNRTATHIRRTVTIATATILAVAIVIVCSKWRIADTRFEFNQYASVEGDVYLEPIPHMLVNGEVILLVGQGKHGAIPILKRLIGNGLIESGMKVRITGEYIAGYGRRLLQVDDGSKLTLLKQSGAAAPANELKTNISLSGEIVDPKCYFGVMNPGEGKAHRSCAIRCISGGIPPVLHTGTQYYILLSESGRAINDRILPLVGDYIELNGQASALGNWNLLYINEETLSRAAAGKFIVATEGQLTMCLK